MLASVVKTSFVYKRLLVDFGNRDKRLQNMKLAASRQADENRLCS